MAAGRREPGGLVPSGRIGDGLTSATGATGAAGSAGRGDDKEGRRWSAALDAVTVGEVLRVALPGARVVGGAAGLARRVAWATLLRTRPPAFDLRGGGELVLASHEALDSLRRFDTSLTLPRILHGVATAGAAALGLEPPVPSEAAAEADALGIPLLELPSGASLLDLERATIVYALDRRSELQVRASQLYRDLAQLAVESRGLSALLDAAAAACGRVVAFEDAQFRIRSVAAPPGGGAPPDDGAGLSSVAERTQLGEFVRTHPLSSTTPPVMGLGAVRWGLARYAAPVVTRERLRGFVSVCGPEGALTEFDQLATARAAAVCAMGLAKEDDVLAAEQRVQSTVVDDLLRQQSDGESAARRAAQAGLATQGPFAVLLASIESGMPPGALDAASLADVLGKRFSDAGLPALCRADEQEVVVVCGAPAGGAAGRGGRTGELTGRQGNSANAPFAAGRAAGNGTRESAPAGGVVPPNGRDEAGTQTSSHRARTLRRAADLIAEAVTAAWGPEAARHISIGGSREQGALSGLPEAAREARDALRIGVRVHGAGTTTWYDDLGLYRVLHALRDSPELRTFQQQTIGALLDHDRRFGQDLVETLDAYFSCHGNASQAAERLQVHRNTLLYRLRRIKEIAAVDLEDSETRLSLQVALRARRLLE
jgi:purine catabolism regulator